MSYSLFSSRILLTSSLIANILLSKNVTRSAHSFNSFLMYSALARQILDLIEDICDQMEYEGSRMFDEYMDRTMLLAMVDKIYDKIDHQEKQDCQKKEQLLYQMILSLLGGEIYHRRCRYRRKRNMFKA